MSLFILGERFLAALILLALGPLLAAIAIFVHSTAGRPVVVVDTWVTERGKAVRTHRFRTTGQGLPLFRAIGRLLREYSVDELPSLWSVACGEVRLGDVGPFKLK
jgi:lipopolysaccharide/colanic/teichoic acid biosynthesis glycosyltransferase